MPGLKKQLSEEFAAQPEDSIEQAAKHALDRLKGVPVDIEPRFVTAEQLLAK